jgi:hypothetical protein
MPAGESEPGGASPRVTSIEELAALMRSDGVTLRVDAERGRLEAANAIDGLQANLLIEWNRLGGAAQVIQVLPWPVPETRLAEAAVAMIRANHQSVLPAFGMNIDTRLAYCRAVVPLGTDGVEAAAIRALVAAVTRIARDQGPGVAAAWRSPSMPSS